MDFPKNCLDCPVWGKSPFKDFSPALLQWLAEKKRPVSLGRKDVLFQQGEKVEGIFCHMDGLAKVVQKDEKGNIRFSRLVLPGDTSGHRSLFIEEAYKATSDVVSQHLRACYIAKADIFYLLSNNASFARNLLAKISMELARSEEEQISVKEISVRGRLARLLCELCEIDAEKNADGQFVIKSDFTKRDIAGFLSVANETVIRLMSEMKSEGLIDSRGKKLIIKDMEQLKKLSRL